MHLTALSFFGLSAKVVWDHRQQIREFWGYLLQGELTVTYADDTEEVISGGDLFYWPPGHTVKVGEDAEVILFSPQDEHSTVIDHMLGKMAG